MINNNLKNLIHLKHKNNFLNKVKVLHNTKVNSNNKMIHSSISINLDLLLINNLLNKVKQLLKI